MTKFGNSKLPGNDRFRHLGIRPGMTKHRRIVMLNLMNWVKYGSSNSFSEVLQCTVDGLGVGSGLDFQG